MPIKPNFTAADIRARMSQMLELRKKALIGQLFYIGEECLTQARSGHKYLNQTGNLCSSIGYCILENGKPWLEARATEKRERSKAWLFFMIWQRSRQQRASFS